MFYSNLLWSNCWSLVHALIHYPGWYNLQKQLYNLHNSENITHHLNHSVIHGWRNWVLRIITYIQMAVGRGIFWPQLLALHMGIFSACDLYDWYGLRMGVWLGTGGCGGRDPSYSGNQGKPWKYVSIFPVREHPENLWKTPKKWGKNWGDLTVTQKGQFCVRLE